MRRAGTAVVLTLALALAAPGAPAAHADATADGFQADVAALVAALSGAAAPGAVHAASARIFTQDVGGDPGRAAAALDCVSIQVQAARDAGGRRAPARLAAARRCLTRLPATAPRARAIGTALATIAARARAGRAFGAMATALRAFQSAAIAKAYKDVSVFGVALPQVYDDLECADVKAQAGRRSGALACARRLARLARQSAPAKPPITFGSDLTGTPQALPTTFAPDDTEFWDAALTVPADGLVTTFRLKTGDSPTDLPLRFSVVRPNGDGTVTVITTTNPVYPLAAHDAAVHTYPTSALSFACCKVRKGDIITVDNSGTTTPGAYVWFAPQPGTSTYSHTSNGLSQNAGVVWTPITHDGYETLLQVVMQPS